MKGTDCREARGREPRYRTFTQFIPHNFNDSTVANIYKLGNVGQKLRYSTLKWLTSRPRGLHCRRCKSQHSSHRRRTWDGISNVTHSYCDFPLRYRIRCHLWQKNYTSLISGDILVSLHFGVEDGRPSKPSAVACQVRLVVHTLTRLVHGNFNVQQF